MDHLRAVLFDLDGVLVDSHLAWFRLVNAAAEHFGASPIDLDTFRSMWGQGVDADAAQLSCPSEQLEKFYEERFGGYADAIRVDPAASPVLAQTQAAGLATAIVTNTPTKLARQILEWARLPADLVVGNTDVEQPKPAPDMLLRACSLAGIATSDSVMIGDSPFDRQAAAAARIRFIGLRIDGDQRIEKLDRLPGLLQI